MPNNGLQSFGFHQYDDSHLTLKGISNALNVESFNAGSKKDINPEIVAEKISGEFVFVPTGRT